MDGVPEPEATDEPPAVDHGVEDVPKVPFRVLATVGIADDGPAVVAGVVAVLSRSALTVHPVPVAAEM
jgi:hypothetical protein